MDVICVNCTAPEGVDDIHVSGYKWILGVDWVHEVAKLSQEIQEFRHFILSYTMQ